MMKYLLDVSSLIALGLARHQFHRRLLSWIRSEQGTRLPDLFDHGARICAHHCASSRSMGSLSSQARSVLLELKTNADVPFRIRT